MIFIWGRHFYGKIESLDGACVRTYFFHLFFLPILPLGSFLIVAGDGAARHLRLPLHGRSLLAGYARMWPLPIAYVGIALACNGLRVAGVLIAVAAGIFGAWAWARLGRLSPAERAQRRTYAAFADAPIDVALVARAARGPDRAEAERWLVEVTARAEIAFHEEAANPQASYRETARFSDWRQAAAQTPAMSPGCTRAALTLARISWADSDGSAREEAARAHARLWSALSAHPTALERAAEPAEATAGARR